MVKDLLETRGKMKRLYCVHTESDNYCLTVKADNADEAEKLAKDWFWDNISLVFEPKYWFVELCDNDEIIE